VYCRIGIDDLGLGKEKTFALAYSFCVYWLKNKVFVMGREKHIEVFPDKRLVFGDDSKTQRLQIY
jgi:hypothetical protein